jgi:hypothetical protein
MKYAVKMGSDAMIYISSFIKTDLGTRKLLVGDTHTDTQSMQGDFIRLLFENKEIRQKMENNKFKDMNCIPESNSNYDVLLTSSVTVVSEDILKYKPTK